MTQQDSSDPTGVTGGKNGALVRARDRKQNAALQLKLAGANWEEIAQAIGYPTPRAALVAVENALERELHTEDNQAAMRGLAGKRLERLLRSVWGKAVDPDNPEHLPAVGKSRELLQDYAKLYGLNAPTEIAVHNPTQEEIQRWVATVAAANAPKVQEYDIIAGEIEEAYETWSDDAVQDGPEEVAESHEGSVHDIRGNAEHDLQSLPPDEDPE